MKKKNIIFFILFILNIFINFNYIQNFKLKYIFLEKIQNLVLKENNFYNIKKNIITIKTNLLKVKLNKIGGDILNIELLKYKDNYKKNKNLFLFKENSKNIYKLQSGIINNNFLNHNSLYRLVNIINNNNKTKIILSSSNKNIKFLKTYIFKKNSYFININFKIFNKDKLKIINPDIYLRILHDNNKSLENTFFYKPFKGFGIFINNKKFKKIDLEKINYKTQKNLITSKEGWIAFIQHYFVSVLITPKNSKNIFFIQKIKKNLFAIGDILKIKNILPNKYKNINLKLYSGPQKIKNLKKINRNLELINSYGTFAIFSKLIFWLLININLLIKNWGWSIIILTLIIKICFLPFSIISQKNINKLQTLSKKINFLKNKCKNKNNLKNELFKIYKKENINPLLSIIYTIIQIPFFLSLFTVIYNSIEIRNANWIWWIKDLSKPDKYYLLPTILSIMVIYQTNYEKKIKLNNLKEILLLIIQISFTIIFFFMPSAIMLYWITNIIFTILQQMYFFKNINNNNTFLN